jgi:hypothetical protein
MPNVTRHSQVGRFEFGPYAVGGPRTGWAPADAYGKQITLATAVAISAAAVSTQSGGKVPAWASVALVGLNAHLGVWLANPRLASDRRRFIRQWSFAPLDALREMLHTNTEEDPRVFVSDGGHDDNLGLAALIERGCRLVVAVDASADPVWKFGDLEQLLTRLRTHGYDVESKIDGMRPGSLGPTLESRIPAQAVGEVRIVAPDGRRTLVVYLKSCVTRAALGVLSGRAQAYVQKHPRFPQESTVDQWFEEAQFDAYVAVGIGLAEAFQEYLDQHSEAADLVDFRRAHGWQPA